MRLSSRWMVLLPAVALSCGGCSTSRLAIGAMTPVLQNSMKAALRSDDPQLVREALPASMLLAEGMLETRPEETEIAALASMFYFCYAFAFVEEEDAARASSLYERGIELGWQALARPEAERSIRNGDFEAVRAALPALDAGDAEALLWLTANWALWIQVNLKDTSAVADLARVRLLAERLVSLAGDQFWGLPHILLGAIHASRPATLGGDPEKAREEFELAFAATDRNLLLTHVFYAERYCVQVFDEQQYEATLREVLNAPRGELPDAELLNQIARQRAASLLAKTEEIFD
jgi:hypothetical protein